MTSSHKHPTGSHRQLLRLALPTLLTLIAEPLFLLADTAIVGHLGVAYTAGLGIASAILTTIVGTFIFLAYTTTAEVARATGAGNLQRAFHVGASGIWLGVGLGALVGTVVAVISRPITAAMAPTPQSANAAATYLSISAAGLPAVFATFGAVGLMRGQRQVRLPLVVTAVGAVSNVALNLVLVYPAGLGIAGSALGTIIVQWAMAIALCQRAFRDIHAAGSSIRPASQHLWSSFIGGIPLAVRSIALRLVLLATTWVAASQGVDNVAAHHVTLSLLFFAALVLDAVAVAGQTMIGTALGAADRDGARQLIAVMLTWSVGTGIMLGALLAIARKPLVQVLMSGESAQASTQAACLVLAALLPLAGYVFAIDGVLIGASDTRYLARVSVLTLIVYLPPLAAVYWAGWHGPRGIVLLWICLSLNYFGPRALTLWWRVRSNRWIVLGAAPTP